MNSTAQRLTIAHRQAGLPSPDPEWIRQLSGGRAEHRYFWRRLIGGYLNLLERHTELTRSRDQLADLIARVELAEAAMRGGAVPDDVARQLDLRPDQMAAILADEAVQP